MKIGISDEDGHKRVIAVGDFTIDGAVDSAVLATDVFTNLWTARRASTVREFSAVALDPIVGAGTLTWFLTMVDQLNVQTDIAIAVLDEAHPRVAIPLSVDIPAGTILTIGVEGGNGLVGAHATGATCDGIFDD